MDFQSEKSFRKLRLRAFQPYHQILCMSKHVGDVEDRSNTHKGCNAMYVEDVEDIKTSHNRCILKYVKDVEDRSIHIRAVMLCMSKTSKMGLEHTHTFWLITSLILNGFSIRKKFWKVYIKVCRSMMSKIDQIHIRAVMLCMSKMSKMGKEHTHKYILAHNFLNT